MTRNLETLQKTIPTRLTRNERQIAREIIANYRAALAAVRAELSKVYERYADASGVLTHADMSRYNRLTTLERNIIAELRPLVSDNTRLLERNVVLQYEEAFYRHAWAFEQAVGVPMKWGILSPEQVRAAVANPLRYLAERDLANATINRIRRAVTQGIIRGSSLPAMMRDVRGAIGTTTYDAMRIARTEAHRARELGSWRATQEAYDNGVRMNKRWSATLSNRTRDTHASMDGQERKVIDRDGEIALERPFQSPSGAQTQRPGGFGVAAEDINCRCTTYDVIEGLEPELRRTSDRGVEPYQTFVQWANDRGVRASRYGQRYNFVRGR